MATGAALATGAGAAAGAAAGRWTARAAGCGTVRGGKAAGRSGAGAGALAGLVVVAVASATGSCSTTAGAPPGLPGASPDMRTWLSTRAARMTTGTHCRRPSPAWARRRGASRLPSGGMEGARGALDCPCDLGGGDLGHHPTSIGPRGAGPSEAGGDKRAQLAN